MKYLLLLYPIRDYAEVFTRGEPSSTVKRSGRLFCTLIRERYRKKGFKIAMVFFSTVTDPSCPDIGRKWKFIPIDKNDIVIACGITFEEHCKNWIYPEEEVIIASLQSPIEELVIGGFHLWDCVDKMARYAYGQGIPVSVDEDLTELFFYAAMGTRGIPISREESAEQTKEEIVQFIRGTGIGELIREKRKDRPWLLQV